MWTLFIWSVMSIYVYSHNENICRFPSSQRDLCNWPQKRVYCFKNLYWIETKKSKIRKNFITTECAPPSRIVIHDHTVRTMPFFIVTFHCDLDKSLLLWTPICVKVRGGYDRMICMNMFIKDMFISDTAAACRLIHSFIISYNL